MEREKIVIELCGGRMPEKAFGVDAAYDVFTKEDVKVYDWNRCVIPLGFKIQPRSGMSSKGLYARREHFKGEFVDVRIDADVKIGLIDSGYTGEVTAIVKTFGIGSYLSNKIIIPAGTKIAQMRIVEIPNTELVSGVIKKEENDDKENDDKENGDKKRGDNGFNSTGVK